MTIGELLTIVSELGDHELQVSLLLEKPDGSVTPLELAEGHIGTTLAFREVAAQE